MTYIATVRNADSGEVVGATTIDRIDGEWYATAWEVRDPNAYPAPEDPVVAIVANGGKRLDIFVHATCADHGCTQDPMGEDWAFSDLCYDHQPRNACEAGACHHHYC